MADCPSGVTGPLVVKTHNGRIEIQGEKAIVTAESSNGPIQFQGSLAAGEHSLRTNDGAITLTCRRTSVIRWRPKPALAVSRTSSQQHRSLEKEGFAVEDKVGQDPAAVIKLHTSIGSITIGKMK